MYGLGKSLLTSKMKQLEQMVNEIPCILWFPEILKYWST